MTSSELTQCIFQQLTHQPKHMNFLITLYMPKTIRLLSSWAAVTLVVSYAWHHGAVEVLGCGEQRDSRLVAGLFGSWAIEVDVGVLACIARRLMESLRGGLEGDLEVYSPSFTLHSEADVILRLFPY